MVNKKMANIHASCVSYFGKGILIRGKSGRGKSDLALRLIMDKGCILVGDDRIDIFAKKGKLKAYGIKTIANMLEVRGSGLAHFPSKKSAIINLVVDLVKDSSEIERLPEAEEIDLEGIKVPRIKICAFEISAVDKIILALSLQ